jgi:hypothetical protein
MEAETFSELSEGSNENIFSFPELRAFLEETSVKITTLEELLNELYDFLKTKDSISRKLCDILRTYSEKLKAQDAYISQKQVSVEDLDLNNVDAMYNSKRYTVVLI